MDSPLSELWILRTNRQKSTVGALTSGVTASGKLASHHVYTTPISTSLFSACSIYIYLLPPTAPFTPFMFYIPKPYNHLIKNIFIFLV